MNNIITFRGKQYNIVGFYRYPSFVTNIEDRYNFIDKKGNPEIEKLYKDIAEIMHVREREYALNFFENKTAFMLEDPNTGDRVYVGAKDLYYTFGTLIRTENYKYFDFKELEYKPVISSQIIRWQQKIIQDRKLLLDD